MSQAITPRVFVSAVSSDLRNARKIVNEALIRIECLPIEESVFGTEYGKIAEMIERKIQSCQAVVHLVGRDYGGEPDPQTLPAGQPRRSWTQLEYDIARKLKKPLYIFVCDDAFPYQSIAEQSSDDKLKLQHNHREAVLAEKHLWHRVRTEDDLQRQTENLKVPLDVVRNEIAQQQSRHRLVTGISAAVIGVTLICTIYGLSQVGRKVGNADADVNDVGKKVEAAQVTTVMEIHSSEEKTKATIEHSIEKAVTQLTNPIVLAERIRKEINSASKAKIAAIPDGKGRGRKISEIEKGRDLALGRVDDLIKLIQEGLKEGASQVFQNAAEILQKEGTDEALAYLESRRQATLEDGRRHAEQAKAAQARADEEKELRNKELKALVLEAELLETKLQWQPAIKLREQVAELAPDWFEARTRLGTLQFKLALFHEAESNLRAAEKLSSNPVNEIIALNNLASMLGRTNRKQEAEPLMRRALAASEQLNGPDHPDLVTELGNLGCLLHEADRTVEAEVLLRRAVTIAENAFGLDDSKVATPLNNLAEVLKDTNRLSEAELLLRRALAIHIRSKVEPERVSTTLNNLAELLQETNRGDEAEPFLRLSIALLENYYGPEHPTVAVKLNNLADLLSATNRLERAEPLFRRALEIDIRTYEPDHPSVSVRINNLAILLKHTNRNAEASSLVRQALAIQEQSNGPAHSDVALTLNNLATILLESNRFLETEALMRRALIIDEQVYGPRHRSVSNILNNLAQLLVDTNRSEEAEPLMRRALTSSETTYGAVHPEVAIRLNNLGVVLMSKNQLSEAEALIRSALTIDEKSYRPDEPTIAIHLNNLVRILRQTNRTTAAEPLARHGLIILGKFKTQMGFQHPEMRKLLASYRAVLQTNKTPPTEIDQRVLEVLETSEELKPIHQEVERLLGPVPSSADVLAKLDEEYKSQGKPAIYFLPLDQPIGPHLNDLLRPNADFLNMLGIVALISGENAYGFVLCEESQRLAAAAPENLQRAFATQLNCATAIRDLGDIEQAQNQLRELCSRADRDAIPANLKGRAHYHLAVCEWRLGNGDVAQKEADQSLKDYGDVVEPASYKKESEQILADIRGNKSPAAIARIDTTSVINEARDRFRAVAELTALPLNQSATPFIDRFLGPAKSTREVLDSLAATNRERNKPAVWFLPLNEPISPHLDELLGPIPAPIFDTK